MGGIQDGGGSVMLQVMFCWETLDPGIHVTLTSTICLNIVADRVHPFMVAYIPNGSGLFQQENVICPTANVVKEGFEEYDKESKVLTWPPNSSDLNPIEYLWNVLEQQVRSLEATPCNFSGLE